jgi:hypothetical protein
MLLYEVQAKTARYTRLLQAVTVLTTGGCASSGISGFNRHLHENVLI